VARDVQIKRIYEPAEPGDGYRVLVDRVWPRGISRERAGLDDWARELGPSDELRKWFGHVPERFEEFRSRYRRALRTKRQQLDELRKHAGRRQLTLLYGARDQEHNNALVLAELLHER
jgi:uncharacterized protein YeaO (DUF488 family)